MISENIVLLDVSKNVYIFFISLNLQLCILQ